LIVAESDGVQVRISDDDLAQLEDLRVDLVDPGESSADTALAAAASTTAGSARAMPLIYTRAQWGADESIREPGDPDYGQILGSFVHHTAGTNSYTEADVPAIIRAIYAYHVNGRGWRDIGYNFLIDRFGRIWEGRYGGVDLAVVGAHTAGYNSNAFGTSVLGTYTSKAPEGAVLDAFERLIAWKFTLHGVDPDASVAYTLQKTLPAISGHRDAGSTECPGQLLYNKLGTIRLGTNAAMSTAAEDLAALDQRAGSAWLTSLLTSEARPLGPSGEWPVTGLRLLAGDLHGDGAGDVVLVRQLSTGLQLYAVPWNSAGFYETGTKALWASVSGGGGASLCPGSCWVTWTAMAVMTSSQYIGSRWAV
jgi:N-acetylmuramoyl-L-alanine amidase